MSSAARAVVIGVGNEYRRDDGVGPAVVARLSERLDRLPLPHRPALVVCDGDPARLIGHWEGADLAVVVDAAHAHPGRPGRVHRLVVDNRGLARADGATSSHGLGLGDAVALARELNRLPRLLVVYAVEGADRTHGTGLSAPVRGAVESLVGHIAGQLARHRGHAAAH